MISASMVVLSILVAIVAGCLLGWLSQRGRLAEQRGKVAELTVESKSLQDEVKSATASASANQATARAERERAERLEAERTELLRQKDEAETAATRAQTQLLEEQKQADRLKQDREVLEDHFKVLSAGILKEQSSSFTEQNRTNLGNLLEPLQKGLHEIVASTHALEAKREGAYSEVVTEIKNVRETHERLRSETSQLVSALRAPKVRGNWGELQLRRCIEFAGMVEHASFDVEVFVAGEEGSIRPDCVVHLPNQRTLIIDAKTPFDSFLDAMQATDESIRSLKLAAHAKRVRQHLDHLSGKLYWKQFAEAGKGTSPDFVICFLSSEVLFSAALEQDPGLIEHGSNSNVILATPTTLIALLKAVAFGWQQMEITRNAIAIRNAGQALYDKLASTHDHMLNVGKALGRSVKHYNSLVGSIEGRGSVFSLAGKMREMGIGQELIEETPPIELAVRDLRAADWRPAGLFESQEFQKDSAPEGLDERSTTR